MTGRSTPKRPLEVNEEDTQSETRDFNFKRYKYDVYSTSVSGSRSSSRSSDGRISCVKILGDAVQQMNMCSDVIGAEPAQTNCLLPFPRLQSHNDSHLAQITSQQLDIQCAGAGSQASDTPKDEEICFGMLRDVQIKINSIQNKELKIFEEIGRDKDIFIYLDLVFCQDRCDVQLSDINVATMNKKTHHALMSLPSKERVRYEALVPRVEFKQKLDAATQPLGSDLSKLTWSMAIQIFGIRSIADIVAKELSGYRLFLQHPQPMPFHVAYENPQYLSMVGSSFKNGTILPPVSAAAFQEEIETHPHSEELYHETEELITVINNLPRHDYLREADIDKRIKTNLLSHQMEAVDFALGRESNEYKSPRMLWRVDDLPLGAFGYRHKITGSRSQAPDDMLGGILADYMGLGKTLTIIATIVTTISRAERFAEGKFRDDEGTKADLVPAKSTLVIVPSTLLLNGWIEEVMKHVDPGTLKYYKYHGPDRRLGSSSPLPYDIVFSTYGTVAADFSRGGGVLNCFYWYRLILDEAHIVRNWSTKQFKGVTSLSAAIRWCVTGTPVQNSLHDLGSLVQFLRVPFLEDATAFRRHIAGKRRIGSDKQRLKPDYDNLKLLLGSICLRRSISTLSLGFTFLEKRLHLSEVERIAYEALAMSCKRSINAVVSDRRAQRGNRAILTALLRLRIFCNTGLSSIRVTESDLNEQFHSDEIISLLQQSGEAVCVDCNSEILSFDLNDTLDQQLLRPHSRLKCQDCLPQVTASNDNDCSSRERLSKVYNVDRQDMLLQEKYSDDKCVSDSHTTIPDNSTYPTKLNALLADIKDHHSQDKCIVFSFWKRSLDLVARLLHENSIVFGQVDGNLSPYRRQKVLAEFHDDPSIRVLLITLGTGAAGLNNLCVASRVHILEPQWNPSVEDQAIGRVLRLGQEKKVCVIRYIMRATIEEKVKDRQMMKIQLALKGGLQSLDKKFSEDQRKISRLQELSKIVESTILTQALKAVSQGQKGDS